MYNDADDSRRGSFSGQSLYFINTHSDVDASGG